MAEPDVRRARPEDLPQLVALVERCSPATLHRRFHGATGQPMRRELQRIASSTPEHRSWVAVQGATIRATATLAWSSTGRPEVAVLVEDSWFRRGLGRRLCVELAAAAGRAHVDAVVAHVQADNVRAVRFVRALAPEAPYRLDGSELEVVVPVSEVLLARLVPVADPRSEAVAQPDAYSESEAVAQPEADPEQARRVIVLDGTNRRPLDGRTPTRSRRVA